MSSLAFFYYLCFLRPTITVFPSPPSSLQNRCHTQNFCLRASIQFTTAISERIMAIPDILDAISIFSHVTVSPTIKHVSLTLVTFIECHVSPKVKSTSPINNICDGSTTIIALLPHQHYHVICHIVLCSMKIAMSTPSATSVSVHVTQSDLTVLDLSPICNQKPWFEPLFETVDSRVDFDFMKVEFLFLFFALVDLNFINNYKKFQL